MGKKFERVEGGACPARVRTEVGAASYIRMSVPFLRQARLNGDRPGRTRGPRYLKIGR